jgi:glycosyltransferase involved in cell wall biosynthesis
VGKRLSRLRVSKIADRLRASSGLRQLASMIRQVLAILSRPARLVIGLPRLAIARFLVSRGRWAAVIRVLQPHLQGTYMVARSARVVASAYGRLGDFENTYLILDRLARQTRRDIHIERADMVRGRLLEVHPAWLPAVNLGRPPRPRSKGEGQRVLYLAKESAPYLHNGFCTRSHETLRAVAGTGTEIVAVTMPGFPASIGIADAPKEVQVDEVTYHHLMPRQGVLVDLPPNEYLDIAATALAEFVEEYEPTVLHIGSGHRGFETALVGRAVAEWYGVPWIYEVRSFFETTWTSDRAVAESAPYFHMRHATESRCMNAADYVVTLSGPMREEILTEHAVPADRVVGIPNAVDIERFQPQVRDERLRSRLGLGGAFVIGYVSNLDHHREGQEAMIKALPILRKAGLNAKVLLVGDGRRREMLEKLASSSGVRDHVVFTGSIPFAEVSAYYAQIDLFVIPRINERAGRLVSPMKPFEAMAMEIPILVSDLPALVEIVDDAEPRGFTYRAEDHADLARAVLHCHGNPEEVAAVVRNAAEWVRRERTWPANGRAFVDAYQRAAEFHGRGAR